MTADLSGSWFGDRAVLVPVPAHEARAELVARLERSLPGREVRAGIDAVLVESPRPDLELLDDVRAALADHRGPVSATHARPGREVVLPVTYDGVDLADVASLLDCTDADLVAAHTTQQWEVAFVGFAPGFGYLEPAGPSVLDWSRLSRLDAPRARVPRGSVALAAGCSAVYPAAMPGGWRLIGATSAVLFDPTASDPALLHPGDIVRFVDVAGAHA